MNKEDKLVQEIQKLGYEVDQAAYKNEDEYEKNNHTFRYWRLPNENRKLKGTPFFHDEENDFIHFTSLEAFYSILNTGYIRLYNLVNMDDKHELEYAKENFLLHDSIGKAKEDLFCLSMCSSKKVLNNDTNEHLLWKLHGRNGNGVILRFSIRNDMKLWYHYHLSKVYYDLDMFNYINELNKVTKKELLDAKLASFLKHQIYEFENEVRLIFDKRNPTRTYNSKSELVYPVIYPDKLHVFENIHYFMLPILNFLKDDGEDQYQAPNFQGENFEIPKLNLDEVILGYRYSNTDLKNFKRKLNSKISGVNVKLTGLKKYF